MRQKHIAGLLPRHQPFVLEKSVSLLEVPLIAPKASDGHTEGPEAGSAKAVAGLRRLPQYLLPMSLWKLPLRKPRSLQHWLCAEACIAQANSNSNDARPWS